MTAELTRADLELRNLTYRLFVELGRAPPADAVARKARTSTAEVRAGWRRLHHAHGLVLGESSTELRMLHPFLAVPTAYLVRAAGRRWYANCAWDRWFGGREPGATLTVSKLCEPAHAWWSDRLAASVVSRKRRTVSARSPRPLSRPM